MESTERYENYPLWMVLLTNLVAVSIYGLGAAILFRIGWLFSFGYLLYILILEYKLIGHHCVDCFYWGKTCGFGKGKLSSWFFKRGDSTRFCAKEITLKQMIPDMLVSLIPFFTGIVLLILKFDFLLLLAVLALMLLTSVGNGFVRGKLACKYCKQRDLGCPADRLINKS